MKPFQMLYPPHCSIRHGPSTTSRARWRAGTQVCGSTVLITQEYSTSPPTSLRSTTAFARTALRTIPSVVTPGSCLWSSWASQSRSPVVNSIVFVFRFHLFHAVNIFGVFAGRTGTFLPQKCLPALHWSSVCCPKRRPTGGLSNWPSMWKVRSAFMLPKRHNSRSVCCIQRWETRSKKLTAQLAL